ncbi:hypothetical protein, partial [Bernardetia sp.]|uniref:hypothetical protein n=1 Tax=Bernardetia sp. TaxID=1937974 RepID=UPI0025BBB1A6
MLIPLSWCCAYGFNFYKFFLYRNLLLDNKYEVVSGKINNHTRQNWELDRIGKESFEIEGVYFNYNRVNARKKYYLSSFFAL